MMVDRGKNCSSSHYSSSSVAVAVALAVIILAFLVVVLQVLVLPARVRSSSRTTSTPTQLDTSIVPPHCFHDYPPPTGEICTLCRGLHLQRNSMKSWMNFQQSSYLKSTEVLTGSTSRMNSFSFSSRTAFHFEDRDTTNNGG